MAADEVQMSSNLWCDDINMRRNSKMKTSKWHHIVIPFPPVNSTGEGSLVRRETYSTSASLNIDCTVLCKNIQFSSASCGFSPHFTHDKTAQRVKHHSARRSLSQRTCNNTSDVKRHLINSYITLQDSTFTDTWTLTALQFGNGEDVEHILYYCS